MQKIFKSNIIYIRTNTRLLYNCQMFSVLQYVTMGMSLATYNGDMDTVFQELTMSGKKCIRLKQKHHPEA